MASTPDDDYATNDEGPSKSERKRNAQALQTLGEQLIALKPAELDALDLPERLRDAIDEARRITSRAASARQRQYIGKLMRDIDPEPIRAALAARSERAALEAQRFKRIEAWRERLITEGDPALEELIRGHPQIDRAEWSAKVTAARTERDRTGAVGNASRELFRALRALFGG